MGPTVMIPETENIQSDPDVISETTVTVDNDVPDPKGRKQPEYKLEYADIACRLRAADFTEQDVAYALGVSNGTIQSWKRKHESFKRALDDGRREQKKRIVARAMKAALGYNYTERNVKRSYDRNGSLIRTDESEFHKEQPGNERLLVFLLTNIDRQLGDKEWQSVNKVEVDESKHVKIVVSGKDAKEQIERLAGELGNDDQ
jgi:hypothetical protein